MSKRLLTSNFGICSFWAQFLFFLSVHLVAVTWQSALLPSRTVPSAARLWLSELWVNPKRKGAWRKDHRKRKKRESLSGTQKSKYHEEFPPRPLPSPLPLFLRQRGESTRSRAKTHNSRTHGKCLRCKLRPCGKHLCLSRSNREPCGRQIFEGLRKSSKISEIYRQIVFGSFWTEISSPFTDPMLLQVIRSKISCQEW